MDGAEQPTCESFRYLLVPADDSAPVLTQEFHGATDEELRETITNYFRKGAKLSTGQREELKNSIVAQATANAAKQQQHQLAVAHSNEEDVTAEVNNNAKPSSAVAIAGAAPNAAPAASQQPQMAAFAEDFVDRTSFEIVPVVMPGRANKFTGTSLYIDDAGRFKELPLNARASKIAQRDIRGDAFLLSNHDDPALDEWRRVDCTVEHFEALLRQPPTTTLDTSNQSAMAQATMLRENEAKKISLEDAARGIQAKVDGNNFFSNGDLAAAIQAYSASIELLEGRRDLHANEAELNQTRKSCFLNRSLCLGKLGRWNEALRDAQMAAALDPRNEKAYYRMATAHAAIKEFAEAMTALQACETICGASEEVQRLRAEIEASKRSFQAQQKSTFAKMFQ